ncbi:MAG: hypothetical protein U0235_12125 [Polyangiaceae bacterium]
MREGKRPADAAADSITGYLVTGAQPIGRFRKVIDRALGATANKVGGDKPPTSKRRLEWLRKPAPAPTRAPVKRRAPAKLLALTRHRGRALVS